MLPAPIPTDLFVPLANVCKSCARHVDKLHHGSSPHRRCRPCELTPLTLRKLFATTATCQKIERHQEDGLEVMGAFVRRRPSGQSSFRKSRFRSQPPKPCSRRLWPSPVSTLVPPAIAACSTKRTRDALHSLSPAFDRVPRRDIISWFFPRCLRRKHHKWQPSLGWLVCVQFAAPRRTADLVTDMSVLI